MDKIKKGYHCACQLHYHVLFPVKYRKAPLDEEVVSITMETAQGISGCYTIEMESIGCDRDHIHLLCSAHPKIAPGEIIRIFKSITAKEIFRRKLSIQKKNFVGEIFGVADTLSPRSDNGLTGISWKIMSKSKDLQDLYSASVKTLLLFP